MPRKPKPPALVGGPYTAPPCEPGSSLLCRLRGRLTVGGLTDAPIPWPYSASLHAGPHRTLLVCGDLVSAIQHESVQAICYHWGVGRRTVGKWRRFWGVERMNEGTYRRWQELAPSRLSTAARARGGRAAAAARTKGE